MYRPRGLCHRPRLAYRPLLRISRRKVLRLARTPWLNFAPTQWFRDCKFGSDEEVATRYCQEILRRVTSQFVTPMSSRTARSRNRNAGALGSKRAVPVNRSPLGCRQLQNRQPTRVDATTG